MATDVDAQVGNVAVNSSLEQSESCTVTTCNLVLYERYT